MADVTVKRVEDFEAIFGGGFRRVRAGLGVSSFGLAVIDLPPNFSHFPEHDQTHDDQEEVYTVLSGRATLLVGGEEHELEPGVFARVGPAEKRKLVTGDEPARMLAMGATPGRSTSRRSSPTRAPSRPRSRRSRRSTRARPSQRKRSSSAGRLSGAAPGPSSARDQLGQPRDDRAGHARVLVPAEVGRRGELVGDRDHRRGQLAALAVAPAAPVRERLDPGAADRDVRLAQPPGAAEAVGDHHRRRGAGGGRDLRADAPGRRVGVDGQQRDLALGRGWRSRFRRWRRPSRRLVSVISTPALGAHHSRALREHQLDQRRVLVEARRQLAGVARRARPRSSRRSRPSALETAFWEITTISSSPGSPALGDQRPEVVALAHLGQARQRPDPQLARASSRRPRRPRPSGAVAELPEHLGGARRRLRVEQEAVAQQRQVLGRVEVDAPATRSSRARS